MFGSPKSLLWGFCYLIFSFLFIPFFQLSAYVNSPRSTADTTDRMNAGGDPPDRFGLKDVQRSPEYIDDWWGRNDYHYHYSGQYILSTRHPTYDVNGPPYYPYPNTQYSPLSNYPYPNTTQYSPYSNTQYSPSSNQYNYYNTNRYYRPIYPK